MGRCKASIVEAEAIDQGLVANKAKQPRLRIAALRERRQRADFDKAEAEPEETRDDFGVLVEAGRHADRVCESQSERRDGEARIGRRRRGKTRPREGGYGGAVRLFRRQREEERMRQRSEPAHHMSRRPKRCRPSSPSGRGLAQRTAESDSSA